MTMSDELLALEGLINASYQGMCYVNNIFVQQACAEMFDVSLRQAYREGMRVVLNPKTSCYTLEERNDDGVI